MRLGPDRVERLCHAIAGLHPGIADMCQKGHCYEFALILRTQFPAGKLVYSYTEGHVYFWYEDAWYDVRGKHVVEPDCCYELCHQSGHRPHRWSKGAGWDVLNRGDENGC